MLKILIKLGFVDMRVRGSHHFLHQSLTGKTTSVPVHGGELVQVSLLRQILRDIDMTVEEYDRLRRGSR